MGFAKKDSVLKPQVQNFSTVLAASPSTYNQVAGTATAVTTAVDGYVDSLDALEAARANGVRSEQLTATKDQKRLEMLQLIRPLYAYIQDSLAISDTAKVAIGVLVKSLHPTPQPVPGFAPLMTVTATNGSIFTLRMADPNSPDSQKRPLYTAGISVFSFVGEEAPLSATDFKFEGNTGKTTIDVEVPATVPAGSTVWFTCFYFNNRKESGPAASPIAKTLGGGTQMPMLKIAA